MAYNYGLLSMNFGLLWGIVAHYLSYLAFQVLISALMAILTTGAIYIRPETVSGIMSPVVSSHQVP